MKKTVIFLGSSVTYGAASQGVSFADFLAEKYGFTLVKEALSGTTLVDNGENSYISRMKALKTKEADLFVCQLSTNDATQDKPLGRVCVSYDLNEFDTSTAAGAIEYIIASAKQRWNCPIAFYTNPKYESKKYSEMVFLLLEIQKKWDIKVIDLWNNDDFNNITQQQRKIYMADPIHPTKAGYLEWWVPQMESELDMVSGTVKSL